jgi:hypothetical protein
MFYKFQVMDNNGKVVMEVSGNLLDLGREMKEILDPTPDPTPLLPPNHRAIVEAAGVSNQYDLVNFDHKHHAIYKGSRKGQGRKPAYKDINRKKIADMMVIND